MMQANGTQNGGSILLTSGGNDQGGLNGAISYWASKYNSPFLYGGGFPSTTGGFSITQGTLLPLANASLRNFVDLNQGESALNFGSLQTFGAYGRGQDGKIILAGEQQAGAGTGARFNEATVGSNLAQFFSEAQGNGGLVKFIAGKGSVASVACGGDEPETPLIPKRPGIDPNFFGLFQDSRFIPQDKLPIEERGLIVLAMAKPSMFLSQAYLPITQEILTLALKDYDRELSKGQTLDEATRKAAEYLSNAGVDADTATLILEQVDKGQLSADNRIKTILKSMLREVSKPADTLSQ
jgi:hypothetical protein